MSYFLRQVLNLKGEGVEVTIVTPLSFSWFQKKTQQFRNNTLKCYF